MWKRGCIGLVICLFVACASPSPTPIQSPLVSPLLSAVVTPIPLALKGPNFEIAPIKTGDQTVSGHGPVDLPITIVDVTLSAKLLGKGVIDDSGNFVISLSKPASEGHAIGIQVVDLAGSPYSATAEFSAALDAKAGPGFRYYPMIGTVYTQVEVVP